MALNDKPYLLRYERSCGVLFDRRTRHYEFKPLEDLQPWLSRHDVDIRDYHSVPLTAGRSVFGAPIILFVDITSACTCRCWYCYNSSGTPDTRNLSSDEIQSLIQRFAQIGGIEVRLSGGEPTLHPDLLEFISLCNELELRTILVSNGMIPNELLMQLSLAPVTAFYLSLQGDEQTHDSIRGKGSYAACVLSARLLAAAGRKVRLTMTFQKENQHCIEHVVRLAAELGADAAFNPLRPVNVDATRRQLNAILTPQEHRDLVLNVVALRRAYPNTRIDTPWDYLAAPPHPTRLHPYVRIGCGESSLCITSKGDVFPCGHLSLYAEFSLGNILHDELLNLWTKSRQTCSLLQAPLCSKCKQCPYLLGSPCFGGCAVTALMVHGALDAGDPYCFFASSEEKSSDCG